MFQTGSPANTRTGSTSGGNVFHASKKFFVRGNNMNDLAEQTAASGVLTERFELNKGDLRDCTFT
jgi:hypothetical protein